MGYPRWVVNLATKVYQKQNAPPPAPRPAFDEVSANTSVLFSKWPITPFNPDDLVTRKSYRVYEEMRTDDQVKGALALKKGAVLSTGWEIESASDSPQDREVRDHVEYELTNMDPLYGSFDDHLFEIMSALDFGFSITEIVWRDRKEGPWAGKVGLRTLKTRKPHQFRFRTDRHDNIMPDGIWQGQNRYSIDKFLIFSYQREFGNWFGTSDLRAAYRPWWLKEHTIRWWGIFNERFGIPIPIGTYPSNASATAVAQFQTMLDNIQANTSFTLPPEYELQLKEASARGANIFQLTVEQMDKAIARAILVPSLLGLSEQGAVGSYSQARKHFDVFLIIIDDLRRDLAEDVVNNQLVSRMANYNYQVEDYPRFRFLPFSTEDTIALLERFIQAIEKGVVTPVPADEVHIRSITDFPERTLEDIEKAQEEQRLEQERKAQEAERQRQEQEAARREEEQTSTPPEGEPGAPPQPPPGTPPQTTAAHRSYVRTRAPNKYERKVNFVRMENAMDDVQADATERISGVIERQRDAMIAVVSKKLELGTLSTKFIDDLDLKYNAQLGRVTRSFLQEAYRIGRSEGRSIVAAKMQQGIPPESALQFFEDKAFLMTGVVKDRLLGDSKLILYNALKTGEGIGDTIEKLKQVFNPYVGDPTAIEPGAEQQVQPYRLETVIRTNTTEALNEGLKHSVDKEIKSGHIIAFEYAAILDGRQTDVCEHLDRKFFKPDSKDLHSLTPPNHYNCRSTLIPVTKDEGPITFITRQQIGRGLDLKSRGF